MSEDPLVVSERRPAPAVGEDTGFFWEGARQGHLLVQRCAACGVLRHPPSPVCRECRSFEWDAQEASGAGTIYSYAVPRSPDLPPWGADYVIAIVELDEGCRIVATIVGCQPADVGFGQRVEVCFEEVAGGWQVPRVRPVGGPAG